MNTIQKFDTIHQYNELLGQETLHPLVNVIDLAQSCRLRHGLHSFGFYTVFLKEIKCGNLRYGCNYYDYQEGTLVFLAPGQVIGVEDNGKVYQPQGMALVFHPDLLRGTTLGRTIKDYTFFSYQVNEALHLSEQERHIIIDCFRNIEEELHHTIDKHSQRLIVSNIELFLNYCVRFYDRQFITRENVNKDILTRFENLLNELFLFRKTGEFGPADSKILCRSNASVRQLFRRSDQKRDRENRFRTYPDQTDRYRKRKSIRHRQNHQRNRL